jgi:hypothetical protein
MGTLRAGKARRFDSQIDGGGRPNLYLDALMAQKLDARPSVDPTTPVLPEKRLRTNS